MQSADLVLVLDNGHTVERGRHVDLMANAGALTLLSYTPRQFTSNRRPYNRFAATLSIDRHSLDILRQRTYPGRYRGLSMHW